MRIATLTNKRQPSVAELRTSNTFAVIAVDQRWATAALVHMDPLGSLYPFQWGTAVTAEAAGGSRPALMADVVTRAWRDMTSKAPALYGRCLVCVAPSLTKSRDAASRIAIEPLPDAETAVPRVTQQHLSALRDAVCTQNVSGSSMVTEIIVHGYRDDGGREVPDPVGAVTTSLEMSAHLVMTDQAVLTAIMDSLRRMRVRVHGVVSPCAAAAASAAAQGRDSRVVAVEISDSDTLGAVVNGGRIIRTFHVGMGSADVIRAAARRLGTQSRTLADWLQNHRDLILHGTNETPLAEARTPGHPPPATLGELLASGNEASARMALSVQDAVKRALPAASAWPVVIMGDDRFACRAVEPALNTGAGTSGAPSRPVERIHGADMVTAPGLNRMAGVMRHWKAQDSAATAATAALDAYYERHAPAVEQTFRRMRTNANNWYHMQGRRWRGGKTLHRIVRTLQSLLF